MRRILVTGALGQIGTELVPALRQRHGADLVVASDLRMMPADAAAAEGPFEQVDCTRIEQIQEAVRRYDVGAIYHLAALLSALAEEKPQVAWDLNMGGLYRVLEVARQYRCQVFLPSSIGAFGPTTPPDNTPQDTIQRPITIYGVTKAAGELLSDYYAQRFGLDARGLRLPGIISHVAPPGRHHRLRRRHLLPDPLRRRHLLPGHPLQPLHLLPRPRHAARHDVHARHHRRHHPPDGGRSGAPDPPQRL